MSEEAKEQVEEQQTSPAEEKTGEETKEQIEETEEEQKTEDLEESQEEQDSEPEEEETEKSTEEKVEDKKESVDEEKPKIESIPHIFAVRTTANREDQVMDFLTSNINKKGLSVYSIIRPHGMRGYIFMEAPGRADAEQACFNVPYARGVLPNEIQYKEIEHMLEQVKIVINIEKGDIVELISGPFKREKAKITRLDKGKEECVVELLEAAVPIPITVRLDAVKVIRRDTKEETKE
ncbi:transcription elongation factor Spt5 [Candidatus Woesearchaeota archaeon CG10_big_fil_rev_8_21_14_0_10_34_8]|nr:MAG: transcription elongation factor Spt5 [Candidatus Woesearchaeota archaeon CG10_big_fil_rev_8_21_14_0_10_34_8]